MCGFTFTLQVLLWGELFRPTVLSVDTDRVIEPIRWHGPGGGQTGPLPKLQRFSLWFLNSFPGWSPRRNLSPVLSNNISLIWSLFQPEGAIVLICLLCQQVTFPVELCTAASKQPNDPCHRISCAQTWFSLSYFCTRWHPPSAHLLLTSLCRSCPNTPSFVSTESLRTSH